MQHIRNTEWTLQKVGMVLLVFMVVVSVTGYLNQYEGLALGKFMGNILSDFYANVSSELGSIVITVLVLDRLNQRRERKNRLILDLGSRINVVAARAVEELKRLRLLTDGSLQSSILEEANLHHLSLRGANLKGAFLRGANLDEADLYKANLERATLSSASLEKAKLWVANLQSADLVRANLQGTVLSGAKLQRANLTEANLKDANLTRTFFDTNTILPDGTPWTPATDMSRFTDPQHSDFWRFDDLSTPV